MLLKNNRKKYRLSNWLPFFFVLIGIEKKIVASNPVCLITFINYHEICEWKILFLKQTAAGKWLSELTTS